ncbi:hypothetical protein SeLEV6574_g08474 [Synchytrium endobioticum]|uniref:Uncharacterized protein n=1 Tax=Synchytrium endobioticum TaxID=286115 RepID=A0A507BYP9_9FUNG|nr:hypothetical protein SeLEV6574_g08474 [Synchytrium endobioticum]
MNYQDPWASGARPSNQPQSLPISAGTAATQPQLQHPSQDQINQWFLEGIQEMQGNQRASQSQAQAQSQPQQPIYLQVPQGIALEDLIDSRPTAPERYDGNQSRYLAFKRQAKDHLELRRATVRTDADKCRTQGNRAAWKYATEFKTLSAQLPDWSDGSLCAHYYEGLRQDLKDVLASRGAPLPERISELIELCIAVDNCLFMAKKD